MGKKELKSEVQRQLIQVRNALQRANGIQGTYKLLTQRAEAKRATWAKDIVDQELEAIKINSENELMEQRTKALDAFEAAKEAAQKAGSFVDVDDEKLIRAIGIINSMGNEGFTDEAIDSINKQFAGDQSALKVLKGVYEKKGVSSDGGISNYLYLNFDTAWASGRHSLYTELELDGYVNSSGASISKLAKMEGVEFNPVIDEHSIHSQEQLKGMSTEQINGNWDEISRFLASS
jgi:hypothetical protein